jgi:micrococcal nuclease
VLIAIAVAPVVAASAPAAETGRFALRGTVTYVVDGDTLDVRLAGGRRERIRLIGVDTPEPAECYGPNAKTRARQLAQGKRVRLIGDATQDTRDRYGRLLAYVVLLDRRDIGRQLVGEGFAKVYVYSRPFQRLTGYRALERGARSQSRGLWSGCAARTQPPPPAPVPPPPPGGGNCAASYAPVCIPPPPPDLDCGDISHRRFAVRHEVSDPDPHRFDGDKDGIGCEST